MLFYFIFSFIWVLRLVKIISLILSQSLGGAKTGDSEKKRPDHLQAEFDLSYMWLSKAWTHNGEMTSNSER